MVQDGYEYASSFQDALALENRRTSATIPNWFEPQYYWNYLYFRSGLYHEQVKRYLELFKDNVCILKFEDLKTNTTHVLHDLCMFLGVEPITFDIKKYNVSTGVYSSKIQFILRHINEQAALISPTDVHADFSACKNRISLAYRDYLRKLSTVTAVTVKDRIIGRFLVGKMFGLLKEGAVNSHSMLQSKKQRDLVLQTGLTGKKPPPLTKELKLQLLGQYENDILNLSVLTKIDFSEWLRAA